MRSPKKAVIKNPSQKYKNDILPQINAVISTDQCNTAASR